MTDTPITHAGFAAIIGAPNAGKSTLTNRLVGTKVAIVTHKVQTTRFPVRGVAQVDGTQIVLVDTPGIFAAKRRLDRAMVKAAWSGADDADAIVHLIDASAWVAEREGKVDGAQKKSLEDDRRVIEQLQQIGRQAFLALNKIDLFPHDQVLPIIAELNETGVYEEVFMISAENGEGVEALEKALGQPERPVVAVVGGAKVSTKLDLLGNLVSKVDHLVIGGGMANTFLAAQGIDVGKSLAEHDMTDTAREIMAKAQAAGCNILLPFDVVVAREFKAGAENETVAADACPADAMILDAGPETVKKVAEVLEDAKTLIWNGPMGAFEIEPFDRATNAAAKQAAELSKAGRLISVAGGGDTVAALNKAGAAEDFTYISTAGGAFLEWMEGKTLPGVAALG